MSADRNCGVALEPSLLSSPTKYSPMALCTSVAPPLELVDFDEPPQAATNMPVTATTVARITDRLTAPSSCGPRPIGLWVTLSRGRRA